MKINETIPEKGASGISDSRLESIDIFRGLAILGMVLVNYLAGVEWVSPWLKHAKDAGFTVADLVAPMFIFAIGLTYRRSFNKRLARDGAWKTYQHFITRFFALLGMGAVFSAGEILLGVDGQTVNWGVLQAIGVAGLIMLVFIRTSPWARLAAGVLTLAAYQFLLDHFWLGTVLASPHGGLLGSISWAGMLLLSTVLADLFYSALKDTRRFNIVCFALVLAGLGLTFWFPVSKNRVSIPYVLLALGLSGMIFYVCQTLVEKFHLHTHILVLWGRNPLVVYLLHLLLLGIVYLPDVPVLYSQASLWLVIIEVTMLLGGLTWVAWRMDRAKIYFSA